MYRSIVYFPGLDALRFFAAFTVVLHHVEQIRRKAGLSHLKAYSLFNNGGLAVSFFFVLSGFLITYLLIREREEKGRIRVSPFYMRRVLRIWPLYYILVILGLLVVPFLGSLGLVRYTLPFAADDVWFYYVLFMPFLVNLFYAPTFLDPLWSIGVEELFYLFWAPLVRLFWQYLPQLCLFVVALKVLILKSVPSGFWFSLAQTLQFEAMAIGGLAAWWLYYMAHRPLDRLALFSKPAQGILLAIILARLFFNLWLDDHLPLYAFCMKSRWLPSLFFSLTFAWLILNVSVNPKSLIPLKAPVLTFLGKISYGIYMYHMLVAFFLLQLAKPFLVSLPFGVDSILIYALVTTGVVAVAALSKRFVEDPILALKARYA
jgi:peptidoglycan/LPS O-acetylase OafA/YrhL